MKDKHALSTASQLLLRSRDLFSQGHWLLVNPLDAQIFRELGGEVQGFHQYLDIYQQACQSGNGKLHKFAAGYPAGSQFDGIVIYMPKAKEQAQMLIANLVHCLKPGGQLLLVGDNKGGVKSAPKLLAPYATQCNKLDSARHCALFGAIVETQGKPFRLDEWQKKIQISVADLQYQVVSLPGVFSQDALDPATRLLLEQVQKVPTGRLLDFGCGAGVIGCFLGLKNPVAKVLMSDVSALALHCAQQSASINGIRAEVVASHGLRQLEGQFDAIYTNPPFHTGLNTDYQVVEDFIRQAPAMMTPGAPLYLVANSFLKYPPILEQSLGKVTTLADTPKFRVYRCQR
ncbi:methyltransferase [Bowmanella dokdonensis]|uniref:Ribosomal RNA small subunit methyltransferase C n=1 Tax=Bowmanella dokdonensis TaxID=751969 RepID=A0A939DP03_9ALTE|nr:methyltransferase [Bowmanella dokdonensis]MBN7826089.1 methyltransferase [Bowmanella dokdonensis]